MGMVKPRWGTTGVKKAGCNSRTLLHPYVLAAERDILEVGDAGFEPATSAM